MHKQLKYELMSQGVIDESLSELGIDATKVATVPAKVLLLKKFFAGRKTDLADCTVCGGMSAVDYRRCPYCGDAELIEETGLSTGQVTAAATQLIEQAAPAKPKRARAAAAAPRLALVPPPVEVPGLPAPPAAPDAKYTVKDLDRLVARANNAKNAATKEIWNLGNELLELFNKSLWMLRSDDAGARKYHSFNKFCMDELGMSATQGYRYMGVSKTFDAQTIAEIGPRKLSLIVHQPEDERARLLAEIKGGASLRDIAAQTAGTATAGGATGRKPNNAGTRTPPVQSAAQVGKAKDIAIMVRAPKAVEIALLGVNTKGKPATSLADDPWGEEEHDNGVITRYVVKTDPTTGVISLVITRRRAAVK